MSHIKKERSYRVDRDHLFQKVKNLVYGGHIKKLTLKDSEGRKIATFPFSSANEESYLAPVLAAAGSLTAMDGRCTISVKRS